MWYTGCTLNFWHGKDDEAANLGGPLGEAVAAQGRNDRSPEALWVDRGYLDI